MHPKILQRVIGNDGSHLRICPAVIKDFTRHQIIGADYPAIVPYSLSRSLFDHDLDEDKRSVRGSLISGLTDEDVRLLDVFEGDEYTREAVVAHPLGPLISLSPANTMGPFVPTTVALQGLEPERSMEVQTYVWCKPISELRPDPWTFEDFVRQNAWKWVGAGSEGNTDYAEVDRRRAMEGIIVRS